MNEMPQPSPEPAEAPTPQAGYRPGRVDLLIVLGLLLLGYFLFFHELGRRYLWSPDEDEYALVNREMVEDGHWIFPTANGEPYSIKPPFFNWMGSLVSVAYGEVNEFTSRLPSAIVGMAGVLLLYVLGTLMFGRRAGVLSALMLATSPLYIEFSRWIQINMTSNTLLIATILCFWWGYSDVRRRKLAYLLMYVPMGIGTLNMGFVNLVMPGIIIGGFLIVARDLRHIRELRIGWGILIYLAIVAPWYCAVSLTGDYGYNLLITTNLTRYFGEFAHARPFYYYFTRTPLQFLPWFFYLPGAIRAFRAPETSADRKPLLLLLVWVAGIFFFFSLSRTKRSEYMLPIFPALALLTGYFVDRVCGSLKASMWKRWFAWPTYGIAGSLTAAGIGVPVFCAFEYPEWLSTVIPLGVVLIAGSAASVVFTRRQRGVEVVVSLALTLTIGVAHVSTSVVDLLNDEKSPRSFCLRTLEYMGDDEKYKMYKWYQPWYAYYSRKLVHTIDTMEELVSLFESDEAEFVLTNETEFQILESEFPLPLHLIDSYNDARLVSNRPG